MSTTEIEKFVKKANICFLKDLEAAVKCGECRGWEGATQGEHGFEGLL